MSSDDITEELRRLRGPVQPPSQMRSWLLAQWFPFTHHDGKGSWSGFHGQSLLPCNFYPWALVLPSGASENKSTCSLASITAPSDFEDNYDGLPQVSELLKCFSHDEVQEFSLSAPWLPRRRFCGGRGRKNTSLAISNHTCLGF